MFYPFIRQGVEEGRYTSRMTILKPTHSSPLTVFFNYCGSKWKWTMCLLLPRSVIVFEEEGWGGDRLLIGRPEGRTEVLPGGVVHVPRNLRQ